MRQKPRQPLHTMRILDSEGQRLYLNQDERERFLEAATDEERDVRTFCMVLAHSGCRLSEALELTAGRVQLAEGTVTFESLKKRRKGIYRHVPVPPTVLDALDMVHGVRSLQKTKQGKRTLLWPWSRSKAWRTVKAVMDRAGIDGPHASPKGLRHGFGVRAVTTGVPLSSLQRWMGHAQLTTTAIYCQAVGAEERQLAERMWS